MAKKAKLETKVIRYTFHLDETNAPQKEDFGIIDPTKNKTDNNLKELYSFDVSFTEKPEMFNSPQFIAAIHNQVDSLFQTFFKCSIEDVTDKVEDRPKSNIIIP